MMPEEWPLAAPAADPPVESARTRGSRRLASVRRDFFLDPAYRLTEQERALMTAMLHDLIGTVAAEVVAALPGNGVTPPDAAALALRLSGSGLLDREELVSLLLRRADEHRIATAFASRAGPRKLPLLPRLVGDADAARSRQGLPARTTPWRTPRAGGGATPSASRASSSMTFLPGRRPAWPLPWQPRLAMKRAQTVPSWPAPPTPSRPATRRKTRSTAL